MWRSVDVAEHVVSTVWPWTVVRDTPEGIVLYLPPGTVGKQRTGERGGPRGRLMVRWDGGRSVERWRDDLMRLGVDGVVSTLRDARAEIERLLRATEPSAMDVHQPAS